MMTAQARVDRMLGQLETVWREFQEAHAGLTDEQLLTPGVTGEWSVRDLIAHVTWWDEEAITHLPVILDGKRPPRYSTQYGGIDAFNALMTEKKRGLSLDDVRREFRETHEHLIDYIQSLPPERIIAEPRFRRRLKLDTFGHYPIHAGEIRAWREEHGL